MPVTSRKPRVNKTIVIEEASRLGNTTLGEAETRIIARNVRRRHGFNPEYFSRARQALEHKLIHEVLEAVEDSEGMPVFINLRLPDRRSGGTKHAYKLRLRMDADEYRQAIKTRMQIANKYIRVTVGLANEALERRGVQTDLKFDVP